MIVPQSAGDVVTLIQDVIKRTRATSPAELYQALNYGTGKAVRAVSAVRPQLFASFVDPFVINANQAEYDISNLNPPLLRPSKLVCTGNGGQSSVLLFSYREIMSREFEDAETSVAGISSTLFYDVLDGMLPGVAVQALAAAQGDESLNVSDTSQLQSGALLTMLTGGPPVTPDGWGHAMPQPYQGFVLTASTATGPGSIVIDPPLGVNIPNLTPVTPLRRRILYIAPKVGQSYSGRLWYVYQPPRFDASRPADLFPPALTRHVDMVVAYALAMLKRGVDDAMEARWQMDATEQRAELMQDIEPLSGQNSTAVGSDLDPIVGY